LEIAKLMQSLEVFPDACHLVGAYALGKAQRVMAEIRAAGYDRPFYLHGALVKLCELYQQWGIDVGEWIPVSDVDKKSLGGEVVLCPPGALADRWSRGLPSVIPCMASGWMQIRARAKQRRVELPMVISDHADWDDLLATIQAVEAREIWITHGQEAALMHAASSLGLTAKPLHLVGFEEEGE
jgi:putative mRNA 3-end processing factor